MSPQRLRVTYQEGVQDLFQELHEKLQTPEKIPNAAGIQEEENSTTAKSNKIAVVGGVNEVFVT